MFVGGGSEAAGVPSRTLADEAMDRYADGDAEAFSTLYDELAPRLLRFALQRLHGQAAAEDVVQQTFLHIHAARGRFVRGAAVVPWAYAIARRLAIDTFRRHGREEVRATPIAYGVEASSAPAPDEQVHLLRSEAALRHDLERLSPALREAFELLKVEGLSVAECAEVLGITRGMVKVRAHRATLALRKAQLRRDLAVPAAPGGRSTREEGAPT